MEIFICHFLGFKGVQSFWQIIIPAPPFSCSSHRSFSRLSFLSPSSYHPVSLIFLSFPSLPTPLKCAFLCLWKWKKKGRDPGYVPSPQTAFHPSILPFPSFIASFWKGNNDAGRYAFLGLGRCSLSISPLIHLSTAHYVSPCPRLSSLPFL